MGWVVARAVPCLGRPPLGRARTQLTGSGDLLGSGQSSVFSRHIPRTQAPPRSVLARGLVPSLLLLVTVLTGGAGEAHAQTVTNLYKMIF